MRSVSRSTGRSPPRCWCDQMCTLIFHNARVMSLDPTISGARLVAVNGDRIHAVGGDELLPQLKSRSTQLIDCEGKVVLPGFVDAHCHVRAYAESLVSLDISPQNNIRTIGEIQNRILEACNSKAPGTWIKANGYSEFHLAEKRQPNRYDLDAVAPLHPVRLTHRSGHVHVLNSLALKLLNITAATEEPPGSLMDRDVATGEPTGVLFGMGAFLARAMPAADDSITDPGLRFAGERLLSFGVTSVQDAGAWNGSGRWTGFESAKGRGLLQPRLTMMLGWNGFSELRSGLFRFESDCSDLRPGGVKLLVGRVSGSLHPEQWELNERVLAIHSAGLQAIIHAIEPPEIEAAAAAIAEAQRSSPRPDPRHRIEHCSVCPPELRKRLAALGITIVMQPSFLYYSGDRYLETVPADELEHLYAIRSLQEEGLSMAFASDFPVSDPNPLVGIRAAATRISEGGREVLPREKTTVSDAIRLYTLGSAAAAFEENIKGSITPGKLADLVILSDDPLSPDAARKNIRVVTTILGGRIVWQANR